MVKFKDLERTKRETIFLKHSAAKQQAVQPSPYPRRTKPCSLTAVVSTSPSSLAHCGNKLRVQVCTPLSRMGMGPITVGLGTQNVHCSLNCNEETGRGTQDTQDNCIAVLQRGSDQNPVNEEHLFSFSLSPSFLCSPRLSHRKLKCKAYESQFLEWSILTECN